MCTLTHTHTAVEFLDSKCMELVVKHLGYRRPIQSAHFYMLVETSGSHDDHDKEVCVLETVITKPVLYNFTQKLTDFIAELSAEGCIEDGTLASDLTKVCKQELTIIKDQILSNCCRLLPFGLSGKR